ncbi:hypothetical protein MMC11_002503 [Xylographa trunciseda]|nr:hypothetical protein [Xylographa trunciseda]
MKRSQEKSAAAIAESPSEAETLNTEVEESSSAPEEVPATLQPPPKGATFESFYLQAVTREFADDIDKVRNASDFKDSSLPILIEALRQGVGIYGEEERERVMSRWKGE